MSNVLVRLEREPRALSPGLLVVRPTSRQLCWRATMGAVDHWPLATSMRYQLGGKPRQISASA